MLYFADACLRMNTIFNVFAGISVSSDSTCIQTMLLVGMKKKKVTCMVLVAANCHMFSSLMQRVIGRQKHAF